MQEGAQRRLVGGVPGQHLIGQRKAVGRHDQRDHHLHAVAAFVAAVAVAALVGIAPRRSGLEIGARQVVEQNLEPGGEQILPALAQMSKQRRLMLQHLVEATIQGILFDQAKIRAEKVRHRAALEPQTMQPPLAAGIDQPVAYQRRHDIIPARALARRRQPLRPESIKTKLLIQRDGQPARTPLPRPM